MSAANRSDRALLTACNRHVRVFDPTDSGSNIPVGKQAQKPSHIFYTACSGIWQSVWIEAAPYNHITQLDTHGSTSGQGQMLYQCRTVHS